jgi:hydroxymethylpyrimidine pyrophosphatase-like HAD family hydrolase
MQDLNQRARRNEAVPAVTLCTGRQEPYVEVLMQAISGHLPAIYENGCGLYFPEGYRFVEHPSITAETREALIEAKAVAYHNVVLPGLGYFQPGKEASLTLYPRPGIAVSRLLGAVRDAIECQTMGLVVRASVSCVDVTPAGIDKGAGVRWLSEEIDVPLSQMGGIGDSTSDLAFLRLVGRSGAPANATAAVKAAVGYTAADENGDGVVDIVRHWCCQDHILEVEPNVRC